MKVYCEQCKTDISKDVDYYFEKIILGRVKCPKCHNIQGRFISDTDMYLYLGICEVVYLILTAIAIFIYDNMDTYWWLVILFIPLLATVTVAQKNVSRYVYKKSFVKLTVDEQNNTEKLNKVRKEINTSFLIFYAMAFGAILLDNYRIEFLFGMLAIIIVTFVKFYINLKNNKTN